MIYQINYFQSRNLIFSKNLSTQDQVIPWHQGFGRQKFIPLNLKIQLASYSFIIYNFHLNNTKLMCFYKLLLLLEIAISQFIDKYFIKELFMQKIKKRNNNSVF